MFSNAEHCHGEPLLIDPDAPWLTGPESTLLHSTPASPRRRQPKSVATRLQNVFWNGGGWGIFWTDAVGV